MSATKMATRQAGAQQGEIGADGPHPIEFKQDRCAVALPLCSGGRPPAIGDLQLGPAAVARQGQSKVHHLERGRLGAGWAICSWPARISASSSAAACGQSGDLAAGPGPAAGRPRRQKSP
ncbi:MAG: hypothetical protein MZV70_67700 [Desulfobacterales bacterium]|nr:hypothetical protein [Desulfobacterales bacterium]